MHLNKRLNTIGGKITDCISKCEGVENKPEEGIYPRCFYPEIHSKKGYFDYIVIGLNPGAAGELERAFLQYIKSQKKSKFGFEDIKTVMEPIVESNDYYKRVRAFLKLYPGNREKKDLNILWTELVKCQSELKNKRLEYSTKKKCFEKFLDDEIEVFTKTKHKKPLLILLGREVETFFNEYKKENPQRKKLRKLKYLELFHPTGSRKFHSYFLEKNIQKGLNRSKIRKKPLVVEI
jgi:hypothetical protein